MKQKKLSSDTKGFLFWTIILFLYFLLLMSVWSKSGGGDASDYFFSNCVFIGFLLNGYLAYKSHNSPESHLTKPRFKIFSETVHSIVTWSMLAAGNLFIMTFPRHAYEFSTYMNRTHPDFVSLLQNFCSFIAPIVVIFAFVIYVILLLFSPVMKDDKRDRKLNRLLLAGFIVFCVLAFFFYSS